MSISQNSQLLQHLGDVNNRFYSLQAKIEKTEYWKNVAKIVSFVLPIFFTAFLYLRSKVGQLQERQLELYEKEKAHVDSQLASGDMSVDFFSNDAKSKVNKVDDIFQKQKLSLSEKFDAVTLLSYNSNSRLMAVSNQNEFTIRKKQNSDSKSPLSNHYGRSDRKFYSLLEKLEKLKTSPSTEDVDQQINSFEQELKELYKEALAQVKKDLDRDLVIEVKVKRNAELKVDEVKTCDRLTEILDDKKLNLGLKDKYTIVSFANQVLGNTIFKNQSEKFSLDEYQIQVDMGKVVISFDKEITTISNEATIVINKQVYDENSHLQKVFFTSFIDVLTINLQNKELEIRSTEI